MIVVGVGDEHACHILKGNIVVLEQGQHRRARVHEVVLASRADEGGGAELVLFSDAMAGAEEGDLHGELLSGGVQIWVYRTV